MAKQRGVCTEFVGVKMTPAEKQRLQALSARVGLSTSGTLKALIAAAEAAPVIAWRPTLGSGQTEGVHRD